MVDRTPVVVGTDGSAHAASAVEWAARYAARRDAELLIVTAAAAPGLRGAVGPSMQTAVTAELNVQGESVVAEAAAIADKAVPGLSIRTEVHVGHSATEMMMTVAESAGVLVVGARGRGAVASAVLGSVSSQIASHAPCPVVVVPGDEDPRAATGPVVVGVDDSANSVPALQRAAAEADAAGTTLLAVHAWLDDAVGAYPAINTSRDFKEKEVAAAVLGEHVAGLATDYPDLVVEQRVVVDDSAQSLIKRSVGAQLVVVGSRGRGGFAALLLGSTSAKVLRHAHCPVMVVRS